MRTAGTFTQDILDVHDVKRAREAGFTGQGVTVGVVDTGVDFSHPDLQGAQATIQNDGPYSGWPFSYDTVSGLLYALDQKSTIGPDNFWDLSGMTGFVHTLPVENADCVAATCSANLVLVGDAETGVSARFTWPNTSKSNHYYYSIHPDYYLALQAYYFGLSYPEGWLLPPAIIVSDESMAGTYDTVYVDINFNHLLTDSTERMSKSFPLAGAVLGAGEESTDVWDLSAGLLTWISDGINQPPGVGVLYPEILEKQPPENGRMLVFIMDQEGHGTSCASLVAGKSRISDPKGKGPTNPLYAGGEDIGGVGGPVIPSMAPDAKIAAFQNGFVFPFDSWTLATLGMDGNPNTMDGVNIVSNSWGDSAIIPDGWDVVSRFAQDLSYTEFPSVSFLVATGNGGHGYGTQTSPGGGSILDVGASTAYGSLLSFDFVTPEQFLYGDIQPWSNRGPGMLGDLAPDVVAVGAWGTAAIPLNNGTGDGEVAYSVFGGTSMSTPVAAGGMAILYQAFQAHNDRWPTWQEARDILLTSSRNLGHDVLSQGSGNIQVSRAVDMALEQAPSLSPSQWRAGSYQGTKYPAFPAVLHPGEQDLETFTVKNPTQNSITVGLNDRILKNVREETFTFSYSTTDTGESSKIPVFLKEITTSINEINPDLVRAQVVIPYSNFDVGNDAYPDNWWNIYFYDWVDHNGDLNLWTDDDHNGRVDKQEIDIDPDSGLSEFNRFTYGYPQSDYLEATVGSQSLSRRHAGVFLGLACTYCGESTTLQVRVTYYKRADWPWLTRSTSSMTIAKQSVAQFNATLSIPADTHPGAYEGVIELNIGGKETIIPVITQVAANTGTFLFGGPDEPGLPYDNAHMFGGFNWNWRYESGDWRLFFTDIPQGSAASGKAMVVDTQWGAPATDIDTWMFGPLQDEFEQQHPEIFGPYGMGLSAGSQDRHIRNGRFAWETNTVTSHELVAAPLQDGLNMIVLHNVLNSGLQFAEQVVGSVYQVMSDPAELNIPSVPESIDPPYLSGTQKVTFTSTADISEGIQVQAFGMSPIIELQGQQAQQDSTSNICSASWIYKKDEGGLEIQNGGLLDISTSSTYADLDLDLYLYQDNGDKKWNCSQDTLKTYSIHYSADEQVKIYFPEDGSYWVLVHGNRVPDNQNIFDIRIRSISGTDLTLEEIPMGSIRANQPVEFTVKYHGKYPFTAATELDGFLLIGTPAVPHMLEVPVRVQPTILLYPVPEFSASSRWVAQTPVTFRLAVQNLGSDAETAQSTIQLPQGLVYEPNSASGPGVIVFDSTARTLSWRGMMDGAKKIELTFRATAQPGVPPQNVELLAEVNGITSSQKWSLKTLVWLNQYGLLFPLIGH